MLVPIDDRPVMLTMLQLSECHAEDHVEGEGICGVTRHRPVEAEDIIGLYKIGLKKPVLYGTTLNNQRCDSKLPMSSRQIHTRQPAAKPCPSL
jgi:hypothetical protein